MRYRLFLHNILRLFEDCRRNLMVKVVQYAKNTEDENVYK